MTREQRRVAPLRPLSQHVHWAKNMMSPFPALCNLCSATSAATQERWHSGENLKPQIRSQARWNFLRLWENDRRSAAPLKRLAAIEIYRRKRSKEGFKRQN